MKDLANKTIWITGASGGIGEGLAYALARRGARLLLSARRAERLDEVRSACAHPDAHMVLPLDLAQPDTLAEVAQQALALAGGLDVMIHNGGISQRARVTETDLSVDRRIMEVNYFGTVALTKALLPAMLEQGSGHFVVVSSVTGKFGAAQRSTYAASKHALHGFFDTVRAELYDQGIRVTMVCPGFVHTDISRNALSGDGTKHNIMDEAQKNGISVERCVNAIVRAIEHEKDEIYVGGKEVLGVYLKRFVPGLFNRILRNAKTT